MAGAGALRALDIRGCIGCFKCLGKPCGAAGRATAVSCGVCINNCRGCCCGCGTCLAKICHCCMGLFSSVLQAVLVIALVLVSVFVVWVYWDTISETAGGVYNATNNATMEYYEKVQNDPNVLKIINRTAGYYDTAKDQIGQGIEQIGNNPDVARLGNQTAEFYDNAKQTIADTFDSIKKDKTVEQAINGTADAWNKIKGWKIWG